MKTIDDLMKEMDFKYFGTGMHKIDFKKFIHTPNAVFLDVRSDEERQNISFGLEHFVEVIHIPLHKLPDRINEISKGKTIGTFCSSGVRSVIAFIYLKYRDFEDVNILAGGYNDLTQTLMPEKIYQKVISKK